MKKLFLTLTLVSLATISLVFTSVHSQESGEAKLRRAASGRIPNQYIVVLKDDPGATEPADVQLIQSLRARAIFTYTSVFNGIGVRMTEQQAIRVAASPFVSVVQEDTEINLHQVGSWGLDRIDQRDLPLNDTYTSAANGAGVTAYIIDTGIRSTHTEFGGRVASGFSAINDGMGTKDCNGHGTHVAGTVGSATYGVAKGVTLVPARVFPCNGGTSAMMVIAALDWVTGHHMTGTPAVANMSLGGPTNSMLDLAVAKAVSDGITFSLSAGNDFGGSACNQSPARVPTAITVGSSEINDARSFFSNIGTCVDIFAPGGDITSTWFNSDTATAVLSGTSMAAPHVAGAAALFLQNNPTASPANVAASLVSNATPDKVTNAGDGSPNRLLFIGGDKDTRSGRDDLMLYRPGTGAIFTLKSNGDGKFTTMLAVGADGEDEPNGINGYDLLSEKDQVFPFDFNGDGSDDLFLYRPGSGAAFVLGSNGNGTFTTVHAVGADGEDEPNGIGGYDLLSANDRVFPFDFNGDGKDDLFLYRPGKGAVFILRSNGDGSFSAVHAVGDNGEDGPHGINGYDLLSERDQVFPFDFDGDGKDDLFLYRPGEGAVFILGSNGDGSFTTVQAVGADGEDAPNGINGYDLLSTNDRVFPFDLNADHKDDLFLYRPGTGAVFVLRSNGDGKFTTVRATGDNGPAEPNGINGYNLLSTSDQVFPFDFDGDGADDLFLYRPGSGAVFVLRSNIDGTFTTVRAIGDNGPDDPIGIGGYDLLSPDDRVFPFDFDQNGKQDLVLYRPGKGAIFVLKSNGDGTFTAVHAVGDNAEDEPNGINGYDLLSTRDRIFALDFVK